MDLDKYKKIIKEITLYKNLEKDHEKKRSLEDMEVRFKKDFRNKEIQYKLKNLYNNDQFIGCICVASQLVEFKIKEIILQLKQLEIILKKEPKLSKDLEKETLGGLITILKKYYIKDITLIGNLKDFNSLRIKAIHKLLDVKFEIEEVENEIQIDLIKFIFLKNNLIYSLERYLYKIGFKIIELKEKNGEIPDENKKIIKKLREKMEELDPYLKDEDIEKNIKF